AARPVLARARRRRPAQLAAAAADTAEAARLAALQLRDELIDRPTRRRLNDDEIDQDDGEEHRDHQQDAADGVGEHRRVTPPSGAAAFGRRPSPFRLLRLLGLDRLLALLVDPPRIEGK